MGDCDPMDVLPQTIKEVSTSLIPILLRTTRQLGNQSKLLIQKKQADLKLFILNKHTETKEHLDFIKPWLEKTWG
jgi:16S rRNA (cytidine1402-2'-O)-methyltransferase